MYAKDDSKGGPQKLKLNEDANKDIRGKTRIMKRWQEQWVLERSGNTFCSHGIRRE